MGLVSGEWQLRCRMLLIVDGHIVSRYVVSVRKDFSILQSILKGYGIALLKMATASGRRIRLRKGI